MNKHRNIIFTILLVLILLVGVGWHYQHLRTLSINASVKMGNQLHEWIPEGTPLASARQIMEQHQFTCLVASYDNMQAITNDPDAIQWTKDFILRNGKTEAVTNISVLNCDWTDINDKRNRCKAAWVAINNKTLALMWWTVSGK